MPDTPLGRFVWHDLMTTDVRAAVEFYGQLVGWGTAEWAAGDKPYPMWTNGDAPLGGLMVLPDQAREMGAPPHWLAYVSTPDAAATASRVAELGGTVLVPVTEIPDTGRFAVIADPQSAVLAIFSPAGDTPGHEGPPEVGEFSWHELITTDYRAAFEFYYSLFGWEETGSMDMGDMGTYLMFGTAGSPAGGMFNVPPEMSGHPPAWLHYIRVGNVDAGAALVAALGGKVVNGPMDVPGGDRVAQCTDPQGAAFALHSTG